MCHIIIHVYYLLYLFIISTGANTLGSVVYTLPDTLKYRNYPDDQINEEFDEEIEEEDEEKQTAEQLLASKIVFEHEKL